ncbi:UDP-galactopyranose mutase [Rhizobium grahamii CCGE 502]|uniref:UDP-galactopyranose mutase n=1 Tax=Rhizobium grahamii CCGE 502 TaxID=990285 RepID=S3ICR0_9HYPH|nr:UDP-galactopyranose mutase [Rhizobium grahamii CCGE 502]
MERFSRDREVIFFEEYIPTDHHLAYFEVHSFDGTAVKAVRPRIPHWWSDTEREAGLSRLLDEVLAFSRRERPILWFYTPMMYGFARHVEAQAVVYDCMDELANFKFASPFLKQSEDDLLARADVVFTGGESLYRAKKNRHRNVHCFPSSVDVSHFGKARTCGSIPTDQAAIPSPRLGYIGVIDERTDLALIAEIARRRPEFSFVFIGPIVKILPEDLPAAANIHYLGRKEYAELPAYLSGWDAALMPFAHNEATRFISPTKTPEYLAAGRPVVSTRIADVVASYSNLPGVFLVDGPEAFARACDAACRLDPTDPSWRKVIDAKLSQSSWDKTFAEMKFLVEQAASRELHV